MRNISPIDELDSTLNWVIPVNGCCMGCALKHDTRLAAPWIYRTLVRFWWPYYHHKFVIFCASLINYYQSLMLKNA